MSDPYGYPPRRPSPGLLGYLLPVLLGMVLAAAGLWVGGKLLVPNPPPTDPNAKERDAAPRTGFDPDEQEAINVFKSAKASVVNVDTLIVRRGADFRLQETQTGTGSGFVWDTDGRIVTNFHVVQEALRSGRTVRVVMADRTAHTAAIVGVSPQHDTAVLQITAAKGDLKPIAVGRSNDLEVGQKVYAIGNPFGLSLTLTKGIVSALDRTIDSPANTDITGAIQVDAAVNPGNSGGPLLDKDGRLIGMNTAITSPSGGNVGIGFAIPVDQVNEVVTELIRNGRVPKPDLGIKLLDERTLRANGYRQGVMVESVSPSGPAAKADVQGLKVYGRGGADPGDLIVAIDGEAVNTAADYQRLLGKHKPGDEVTLRIRRGKQESDVTLTVQGV